MALTDVAVKSVCVVPSNTSMLGLTAETVAVSLAALKPISRMPPLNSCAVTEGARRSSRRSRASGDPTGALRIGQEAGRLNQWRIHERIFMADTSIKMETARQRTARRPRVFSLVIHRLVGPSSLKARRGGNQRQLF